MSVGICTLDRCTSMLMNDSSDGIEEGSGDAALDFVGVVGGEGSCEAFPGPHRMTLPALSAR